MPSQIFIARSQCLASNQREADTKEIMQLVTWNQTDASLSNPLPILKSPSLLRIMLKSTLRIFYSGKNKTLSLFITWFTNIETYSLDKKKCFLSEHDCSLMAQNSGRVVQGD